MIKNYPPNIDVGKKKKKTTNILWLFLLLFSISFSTAYSQEICNDGIDNDGDGYIDNYDNDCNPIPNYACTVPQTTPSFIIGDPIGTTVEVSIAATPTIGDIDGDGMPEIIVPKEGTASPQGYYIFEGDGSDFSDNTLDIEIPLFTQSSEPMVQPAIADLNGDGQAEIITLSGDSAGNNRYIYVFSSTGGSVTAGTYLWRSDVAITRQGGGSPKVVDIDEDGIPEIVTGNAILKFSDGNFNAATTLNVVINSSAIGQGLYYQTKWDRDPVVMDVLPAVPGKELVAGSRVYSINLATGTRTLEVDLHDIDASIPLYDDGPTSVADMNLDGVMDIVYSSEYTAGQNNENNHLIIWDPVNQVVLANYTKPGGASDRSGIAFIANVYDDTQDGNPDYPEAIFTSSRTATSGLLFAVNLNDTANVLWQQQTTDVSGATTLNAFDFNGDGLMELVYRDTRSLRIMNGNVSPPTNYYEMPYTTGTWVEGVAIADVDNDGEAEIITCANKESAVNSGSIVDANKLWVFSAGGGTHWIDARAIWNQRDYHYTNINDDLTVPPVEQSTILPFPQGTTDYQLNTYMAQLPEQLGPQPAADLTVAINSVVEAGSGCPNVTINYTVTNSGDADAPSGISLAAYDADPTVAGANFLGTFTTNAAITAGNNATFTGDIDISGAAATPFVLYLVVNEDGTAPLPLVLSDLGDDGIAECDYSNNMTSQGNVDCVQQDTDGDGIPDNVDLDDDNDGILDTDEGFVDCATVNQNGFNPYLVQAAYHATLIKTSNDWIVSGQSLDGSGNDQLTFDYASNIYTYPAGSTPLKMVVGGKGSIVMLFDNGDFYNAGHTSTSIGNIISSNDEPNSSGAWGQANLSLPAGVNAGDVDKMAASGKLLLIVTSSGELYVTGAGASTQLNSNFSDDVFNQVSMPAGVTVKDAEVAQGVLFILGSDNQFYTYGDYTYYGDGSGTSSDLNSANTTAHLMTQPALNSNNIVQFDVGNFGSYMVLDSSGVIHVLGENTQGQLGIGNTSNALSWSTVKDGSGTTVTNAKFIQASGSADYTSPNDGNTIYSGYIDDNHQIYLFGYNSSYVITDAAPNDAVQSTPVLASGNNQNAIGLALGGHISPYVSSDFYIFNTGHNAGGGFGDGTTNDRTQYSGADLNSIVSGVQVCTLRDTDGDDIPDYLDLDSDNDGISDLIESGQNQTTLDADNNGVLDSTTDADNDGLMATADADDTNATSAGLVTPVDTDGDGINDYIDLDADNDGIPDAVEAQPTTGYQGNDGDVSDDVDANGIPPYGLVLPQNTDSADNPDYLDTDSDNDGTFDIAESGLPVGADGDNDGVIDAMTDVNGDGADDGVNTSYQDPDGDVNDSINDLTNTDSDASDADYRSIDSPTDTDGDGIPDNVDLDDDNDGIPDVDETQCASILTGSWTETAAGSGIWESQTGSVGVRITLENAYADFWGSGYVGDVAMDNTCTDFTSSETVAGHTAMKLSAAGANNLDNANITIEFFDLNTGNPVNVENPVIHMGRYAGQDGNLREASQWNLQGGLTETQLSGANHFVASASQIFVDDIGGPVPGTAYSCGTGELSGSVQINGAVNTIVYNVVQIDKNGNPNGNSLDNLQIIIEACAPVDTDGDGIPNHLDLDSDNDGISDLIESGQNQTTLDADNNGVLDSTTDADNDGLMATADADDTNATSAGLVTPVDTDGDGINDYIDLDADNDGIPDAVEAQPTTGYQGNDGDVSDDVDANGIPPYGLVLPQNTDGTDNPDYLDTDSDNDGTFDIVESGLPVGADGDNDGVIDAMTDVNGDGADDGVNTSYQDPDGDVNAPLSDLTNVDSDVSDVDYRSLDVSIDTDGDGIPNIVDLDNDNDGIPDSEEGYCDQPDTANPDSGNGLYPDQIYIFDWTDASFADGLDVGDSQTFDLPNGLHIVATVTDVSSQGGDPHTYTPRELSQTWGSAKLHQLYNTSGSHEAFYSPSDNQDITVEFHFDVTLNGAYYPIDLLALDAEATYATNETLTYTTNGGAWQLLEQTGNGGDFYGVGTQTLVNDRTDQSDFSIYFSQNATNLRVAIDAGGRQGIAFGIRLVCDRDGDGIPNRLDLDSDNDGTSDIVEAGGTDADNDGHVDYPTPGDPTSMTDADGDGLADEVDNIDSGSGAGEVTNGTPLPNPDTDGDGLNDVVDIDADNDGIVDNIEGQTTAGYVPPTGTDTDGDGLDDAYDQDDETTVGIGGGTGTAIVPTDTDGDTTPDYLDLDSDDDGDNDALEGWDTNNDGTANITPSGTDADNDGLDDAYDMDDTQINPTNGQTPTSFPNADDTDTPERDWREVPVDTDGDGIPDLVDLDDDNDGIPDTDEGKCDNKTYAAAWFSVQPNGTLNQDGYYPDIDQAPIIDGSSHDTSVVQSASPTVVGPGLNLVNHDYAYHLTSIGETSMANAIAADDYMEYEFTTPAGIGSDLIVDKIGLNLSPGASHFGSSQYKIGILFSDDNFATSTILIQDYVAYAADNQILSITPSSPLAGNTSYKFRVYLYGGVDDATENYYDDFYFRICTIDQDSDGDGIVDSLDLDSDNDGISDLIESGQDPALDADNNGVLDSTTDADNDGLMDTADADDTDATSAGLVTPVDTDGDGIDDYLDLDADNDGIPDAVEAQPTTGYQGNDGDVSDDVDANGIPPYGLVVPQNTDGTDNPDYLDTDSDNDGTFDIAESGLPVGADGDNDGVIDAMTDANGDGADDGVNTSYQDPDGDVNDPINDLTNADSDASDADYRSLNTPTDTDGDGIPDDVDIDDDNDGIPDTLEGSEEQVENGNFSDNSGTGNTSTLPNWNLDNGTVSVDASVPMVTMGGDLIQTLSQPVNNLNMTCYGNAAKILIDIKPMTGVSQNNSAESFFEVRISGTTYARISTGTVNVSPENATITYLNGASGNLTTMLIDDRAGADEPIYNWEIQLPNTVPSSGTLELYLDGETSDPGNLHPNDDFRLYNVSIITALDTDGDGIQNCLDLDSDNDGIPDVVEAGGTDADNDGHVDYPTAGDPTSMVDADGDGLSDDVDTDQGGTALPNPDTDGDGINDVLDIDADNDGIVDNIEGQTTAGYTPPTGTDTDGDGLDDAYDQDDENTTGIGGGSGTAIVPTNTDGTDNPDYLDLDSDNDGDSDALEAWDTDNDGTADTVPAGTDADNDGLDDAYDNDDTQINPTNGQDPTNFPDLDAPGGDRDWREVANQAPTATDDIFTTVEDTTLSGVNIITGNNGNGVDSDPDTGDTLSVTNFTVGGTTYTAGSTVNLPEGDLTINTDGSLTFVPSTGFTGSVPQVTYTLSDGNGGTDTATIDISVLPDNDGDGIADVDDLDDDNDGIPDVDESAGDTDGDGIPDVFDLDSDNDGIPDVVEAGGSDPDGDGVIGTGPITDTDGDGLSDIVDTDNGGTPLANPDTDGDGVNDVVDLDSDNDGIPDVVEAGGQDPDGDGVIGNGPITDPDGDGFSNITDTTESGTPLANPDTDGDGVNDVLDLDSDNDGIQDVIEAGGQDPDGDGVIGNGPITDPDGDGFSNITDTTEGGTPLANPDTDNDGIPDNLDVDSDNDGLTDVNEAGGTDANGDGRIDGFTDADGDGFADTTDTTQGGTNLPQTDTDGDGHPDYLDIDSDNDGIPDNIEAQTTADYEAPTGLDSDGDGIDNQYDPDNAANTLTNPTDTDGDGTPDYLDTDSDGDGLSDAIEGWDTNDDGVADTLPAGTDADNDGLDDAYDMVDNSATENDGTNNTDPTSYPDNNVPGGDRDWREVANQAPTATDDIFTTVEDTTLSGVNIITGNNGNGVDSDPDTGDTLSVIDFTVGGITYPAGTTANLPEGDLTIDADGSLSFVPATDFTGSVPQVTYTLSDNYGATDTATVDINVQPDNDGDGIPDYVDLDDDNDGIPDVDEYGSCSTGVPVINLFEDFGSGSRTSTPFMAYCYEDGTGNQPCSPQPGNTQVNAYEYAIVQHPKPDASNFGGWITNPDHTGNNDGRMLVINGDVVASELYRRTINISPNVDVNAEFWVLNVIRSNVNNRVLPNLTVRFEDMSGTILGTLDTGDIIQNETWQSFNFSFSPGNNTQIQLVLISNAVGLMGNDFAIDDIKVSQEFCDLDGDGIPDVFDIDSDNDGIPDVVEAGGSDPDGDGVIGSGPITDTDGDGLSDIVDTDNGGTPLANPDTDGDGVNDAVDLDSDNDGIPDVVEAGGSDPDGDGVIGTGPITDPDGDGFSDVADTTEGGTALANPDTDGDGVNDVLDLDSDNDGIQDVIEAGGDDPDGDGVIGNGPITDPDGDGFSNITDTTEGGTPLANPDTDNDGIPDNLDVDSDNDGLTDVNEAGGTDANGDGRIDGFVDADGDGFADSTDTTQGGTNLPQTDTDGDGHPDYLDIDADNDGIPDNIEAQTTDDYEAPTGIDTDGDGLDNQYDPDNAANTLTTPTDTDGDTTPDYLDMDSDNDGRTDAVEGWDTNDDGVADTTPTGTDADNDGLDDAYDTVDNTATENDGTNNTTPVTYPDNNNPGGDRDWREVLADPELTVTKDDTIPANATVGDDIVYTIVVTNTGNVPLNNVQLTDANALIGGSSTITTLAPGQSVTFTAIHTITQADMNNGSISNTAVASTTFNGNPVSDDSDDANGLQPGDNDPTVSDLTPYQVGELTATLDDNDPSSPTNPSTYFAGDNINYTLNIENTGNVSITNPQVPAGYTPVLSGGNNIGDTNGDGILDPGETWVYTGSHTLTQAEIDAGMYSSQVQVSGTDPNGATVTDSASDDPVTSADNDPTNTYFNLVSELEVKKTDALPAFVMVGNDITYTITVTNTGNTTLSNIMITDPNAQNLTYVSGDDGNGTLEPGETWVYTATHTITQADMDAGAVSNQASVSSTNPQGDPVNDDASDDPDTADPNDPTVSDLHPYQDPSMTTEKEVLSITDNGLTGDSSGDVIHYQISVQNTGNITINSLQIIDMMITNSGSTVTYSSGDTNNDGNLDVNETWVYTADYVVTQADIDNGMVVNSAVAYGIDSNGTPLNDVSDDPNFVAGPGNPDTDHNPTVTNFTQSPELTVTKQDAVLPAGTTVGDYITYTIVVTNTGNVTVDAVSVTDTNATMNGVGSTPVLAPGDSVTFTAVHQITQDDMDAGFVDNQATANATDPNGNPVTDLSDDPDTAVLDDPTHTDLTPFQTVSMEATLDDNVQTNPVNPYNYNVGDDIVYTAELTNTGNVSITPVTPTGYAPIEVGGFNVGDTDQDGELDPGEVWQYTTTHTVTQADIDAGHYDNQVTFTGTAANGDTVSDVSDDPQDPTTLTDDPTITYIGQFSELTVLKTGIFNDANANGLADVGETITYTITVTNTGNQTITDVQVNDPNAVVTPPANQVDLLPGESYDFTATHTLTQADIDAAQVENQAMATGQDPANNPVSDISDDPNTGTHDDPTIVTIPVHAELTVEKTGEFTDANGNGYADVGEVITYTFTVHNAGNQTISNVSIDDPFLTAAGAIYVSGDTNGDNLLQIDEDWVFTGEHVLTQADIDAGIVHNQALVQGEDPQGNTLTDLSDDPNDSTNDDQEGDGEPDDVTSTNVPQHPELQLFKYGHFNDENGNGLADIGETISYTFTVINIGNVTLTNIEVTDALPGIVVSGTPIILAPGQSDNTTFTAVYTLTKDDIDNGKVTNTALVTADDPQGNATTDISDNGADVGPNADSEGDGEGDDPTVVETLGLDIMTIFTPNGDGKNDTWEILGIQNFMNNTVKVYNRWGNLVYEKDHYTGNWDGTSNGRWTIDAEGKLPVGTYFYVIDLGNGHKPFTGYLYLNR